MPRLTMTFLGGTIRLLSILLAAMPGSLCAVEPAATQVNKEPRAAPDWAKLEILSNDNSAYLKHLRLMRSELDRFKDDAQWRDVLSQTLGANYSFVGRCQKALECFEERQGTSRAAGNSTSLAKYQASDAVETILDLAERRQVIMINEAHHVPLHRAFTIQLLEGLHRRGFRYFAAEALTAKDDALSTRGYPTLKTGYYLHEPICADLVRIAMQIGYRIVPYEYEPDQAQADDDPAADVDWIERQNAREEGQAKNLQERILNKDPRAKILVHAGYAHIAKSSDTWELNGVKGEVRLMAFAFQQLTGIEPLSIDQTQFVERSDPEDDNDAYRSALQAGLLKDKPVVLRDKVTNELFGANGSDLVVLHPRTRYVNGRPTWLALGGRREPHAVKTEMRPPDGASYLAQAFYEHEIGSEAVPVDQMQYGADEPIPTLWLPPGSFRIRVVDEAGKTLDAYSRQEERQ